MNRSSSMVLVDKTPYEAWACKNPSLKHLKAFGCDSFVHIPKEKRSKLNNKSKECIFNGYKDGVKMYKLWNLVISKVVYSKV